ARRSRFPGRRRTACAGRAREDAYGVSSAFSGRFSSTWLRPFADSKSALPYQYRYRPVSEVFDYEPQAGFDTHLAVGHRIRPRQLAERLDEHAEDAVLCHERAMRALLDVDSTTVDRREQRPRELGLRRLVDRQDFALDHRPVGPMREEAHGLTRADRRHLPLADVRLDQDRIVRDDAHEA